MKDDLIREHSKELVLSVEVKDIEHLNVTREVQARE